MNRRYIWFYLAVVLTVSVAIILAMYSGLLPLPVDKHGKVKPPVGPTGEISLIISITLLAFLLIKTLAGRKAARDPGRFKEFRMACRVHPYLALTLTGSGFIHMSTVLMKNKAWKWSEWTGALSLLVIVLITAGGLYGLISPAGRLTGSRNLHKWIGAGLAAALVLHIH